jgi:hypothetical protein
MNRSPDIKRHPNQESKSGRPSYASPVKRNASTNDPLQDEVVGGVEQKMKTEIIKAKKSGSHGQGSVSRKRRTDTDR